MTVYKITIDESVNCIRCGKGGAVNGNYCMACILKNLEEGKYKKIIDKYTKEIEDCYPPLCDDPDCDERFMVEVNYNAWAKKEAEKENYRKMRDKL